MTATIKCIVVDDEPLAVALLSDYVSKVPFLELVFSTGDPLDALQRVQHQRVDLIFLDIQMPQLTGLQFMKINAGKSRVILTTAYSQYALDGYEHNVVDYLLKPVSFDRFYAAALKAYDLLRPQPVLPAADLPAPTAPTGVDDFIFVKADSRIIKILLPGILYIEGLKDYIAIHTATEKILILESLKTLEERLAGNKFLRIHKSYIVSIDKIDSIERNRVFIGKDIVLPIGETYRELFFDAIRDRNFG